MDALVYVFSLAKLCHQRDFTTEVPGTWLHPKKGNRPQTHFVFGDPRHCLARASLVLLEERKVRKWEPSSSDGDSSRAMPQGKKPMCLFPKAKHHQHQKPRISLCTQAERPRVESPSAHCIHL